MSLLAQNERLARRVGAITLCVLGGAIAFFVFLFDKIELGSPTRIRVYFTNSTGLRENAPFVVGGAQVGRIEAIESVAHGGDNPLNGDVGTVAIVAIEDGEAWKVPANADIFVSSRGILSERYLEVAPGGDPAQPVREGAELRGADPPMMDTVLRRTWANMLTMEQFVAEVGPELAALRTARDQMIGELAAIATQIDQLLPLISGVGPLVDEASELVALAQKTYEQSLGGATGVAAFQATVANARALIGRLRATIDQLAPIAARLESDVVRVRDHVVAHDPPARVTEVLAKVRAALDKVDPLLATVEDISARFARHEGSIGRLMYDPEFPEDAKELGKILKRRPWKVIAKPKD
ncbi:MAG: MlaD family protein [Kofleriaceae bacterium]